MALARTLRMVVLAAGVLSSAAAAQSTPASAQSIFFDWSGGSRETVSFSQQFAPGQLIVSFGDRRLYHVVAKGKAVSYPIAVPREQSRWSGVTSVSMKRANPAWNPTPTMRRENPTLPAYVPGGHPRNPLGVRALYLGASAYRIHGTDAPGTIGQAVSKGCIRMYNEDVLHLYDKINVGTKVVVTWQKFGRG
jgi:lipoprotein-anchoring transpeptidase ErfK/SrfK